MNEIIAAAFHDELEKIALTGFKNLVNAKTPFFSSMRIPGTSSGLKHTKLVRMKTDRAIRNTKPEFSRREMGGLAEVGLAYEKPRKALLRPPGL
jgi:hypothetical protein